MAERKKFDRKAQPRCSGCNHPVTFHGGEEVKGECRASGCRCGKWKNKK